MNEEVKKNMIYTLMRLGLLGNMYAYTVDNGVNFITLKGVTCTNMNLPSG